MDTFKKALKAIKSSQGFSILEMSTMTGVNRNNIGRYLRGASPSPSNRIRMANGLLATNLERAGFLSRECEECGTTFSYDPGETGRKFCKRKCNARNTAAKKQQYKTEYVLARATHDLEDHMEAVARFCDWCTGSETRCPEPRTCPLGRISPYNYDNQTLTATRRDGILPRRLDSTGKRSEETPEWAVTRRSPKTTSS